MNYVYSPSTDGMYPLSMKDDYIAADSWPEDGVEITEALYKTFNANPPEGKKRAWVEGKLFWIDLPPKSNEEINTESEATKSTLIADASQKIVIWQTKLLMGRKLTDTETSQLNAWMDYIDKLTAVDTETGKEIDWPKLP